MKCEAEVTRIIVSEQHKAARAAGWQGRMGSRQLHDRQTARCGNTAKHESRLYPPRNVWHDWAMVRVPAHVCGVHGQKGLSASRIDRDAYLERFDPETGRPRS